MTSLNSNPHPSYNTPDNFDNDDRITEADDHGDFPEVELEEDPTDEELSEIEEDVEIEETHTQFADAHGTQNAATAHEAQLTANEPEPPTNANGTDNKKESAYRKRLNEKGLDAFPLEAPKELIDMLRVAAEQRGGLALAALTRELIADYVNSLNLTHIDTTLDASSPDYNKQLPWKFNKARLSESRTRTSTRGLSEEQKAARVEHQKEKQKIEREIVKALLAKHRAEIKAGKPEAVALEATLAAGK